MFRKKAEERAAAVDAERLRGEIGTVREVLARYRPGTRLNFGAPTRCPRCGDYGFADRVDRAMGVSHNHCLSCDADWIITKRAINAVERDPSLLEDLHPAEAAPAVVSTTISEPTFGGVIEVEEPPAPRLLEEASTGWAGANRAEPEPPPVNEYRPRDDLGTPRPYIGGSSDGRRAAPAEPTPPETTPPERVPAPPEPVAPERTPAAEPTPVGRAEPSEPRTEPDRTKPAVRPTPVAPAERALPAEATTPANPVAPSNPPGAPTPAAPAPAAAPTTVPSSALGLRVLVVEDNPFDMALLEELIDSIEGADIELLHAPTRADGERIAATTAINIVLLDLNLPDSAGIDTLLGWKQAGTSAAPVIVMSGSSEADLIQQAREAGAVHYVQKNHLLALADQGPSGAARLLRILKSTAKSVSSF